MVEEKNNWIIIQLFSFKVYLTDRSNKYKI